MKWVNAKQRKSFVKLDEILWYSSRWDVPNRERWYDGSLPIMRELIQLSNKDLQSRYFTAIQQNRNRNIEGNIYLTGDALLCRIEFGRRLDEGLVKFKEKNDKHSSHV